MCILVLISRYMRPEGPWQRWAFYKITKSRPKHPLRVTHTFDNHSIARECQDSSWLQSWGAYPTNFGLTMW